VARVTTRLDVVEAENVALKAKEAQLEQESRRLNEVLKEVVNEKNDNVSNEDEEDDEENEENDDFDDDSNVLSVSERVNLPLERKSDGSDLVQFASILQSSHARAPTLKDLGLELIKSFMRAYEAYHIETDMKILKAPQRFMRSDVLATVWL
jgi:hypothetical protein